MIAKIFGAMCVILGCGGFGFMIANNARNEITALRQLIVALDFMECELNYRMTSLPQLCRLTGSVTSGCIRKVFFNLADELERYAVPSVDICISSVINRNHEIPTLTGQRIAELGRFLGTFDLTGQIKCIKTINAENTRLLENLRCDHSARLKSYKTLSLCAGAALVILFI